MVKNFVNIILILLLAIVVFSGCGTTHYEKVKPVQSAMIERNFQKADQKLEQKKVDPLLYYLDKAMIAHLAGNYTESNRYFEDAIKRIDEIYAKSISKEVTTYLINEKTQPYRTEDFESVLIHYYMAMNYLMMDDLEDALVECRRVNVKLQEINDKYKDKKNVYKSDAFVHYLMGMIYEADHDLNNAFIAYRNAYETYTDDYQKYYGLAPPTQLKKDLLRTSQALGFDDQFRKYRNRFSGIRFYSQKIYKQKGEIIFIWDNGLAPVKEEDSINLQIEGEDKDDWIRVAFPYFKPRPPSLNVAKIAVGNNSARTQLFEDIAQIAIKNLKDRKARVIAKSAARAGIKYGIQKKTEEKFGDFAGFLVNMFNVATEQADTRSWITLPDNIQVARLLYSPGTYTVDLDFYNRSGAVVDRIRFENVIVSAGEKTFLRYRTFE